MVNSMTADTDRYHPCLAEESSFPRGKRLHTKPIAQHRWMPNARERARVRAVRDAFDRLHDILPQDPAETQLRQIDILCRSMEYIRELERRRAIADGDVIPPQLIVTASPATTKAHTPAPSVQSDDDQAEESVDAIHSSPDRSQIGDFEQPACSSPESTSASSSGVPRRKVLPHRVAINAHMRKRSRQMRKAFDTLRQIVPVHPGEPHLDKANTLRRAAQYVEFLGQLLREQASASGSHEQDYSTMDNFKLDGQSCEGSTCQLGISRGEWSALGWGASQYTYSQVIPSHNYQPWCAAPQLPENSFRLHHGVEQGYLDTRLAVETGSLDTCASMPVFPKHHVVLHYPVTPTV